MNTTLAAPTAPTLTGTVTLLILLGDSCEASTPSRNCSSAGTLNRVFLRRGWFTPVSPGTMFVTIGGMVAADVHGKNHHRDGCFGAHVRAPKHPSR